MTQKRLSIITTMAVIAALIASGCPSEDPTGDPSELRQSERISDCGGFEQANEPQMDSGSGYCDAERLIWSFDDEAGTLALTDSRVLLNCCGEHHISAELIDGVYVVTETDAPVGDDGRCSCMCVFDFELTLEDIEDDAIEVRLMRHVTDEAEAPGLIWEGELDLSSGSGEQLLDDEDVGPWCEEEIVDPVEDPEFSGEASQCGGFNTARPSDDLGYCDAEQLHWDYDPEARSLDLLDARVLLNCCGDRDISVSMDEGVYVVTETDRAEGGEPGGRCNCMCVFDFAVTIEDVADEVISVRLVRDSDEDPTAPAVIWEGELDMTARGGVEVVDEESVGGWCSEPAGEIEFESESSDCGGFSEADEPSDGDDAYCDAERLDWVYDEAANVLSLTNTRVLLNCCGEHDISIAEVEGVYVITETDRPEGGSGGDRCDCMCVFDFALRATGIPAEAIPVRLMRHVTDAGESPVLVWEGELDLTLGAGSVEIDDSDVGFWCGAE